MESPTSIIGAAKGTPEYDDIMHRLKSETYKHQAEDGEDKETTKGPEK